jgi:hypothetical protein
MLSPAEPSQGSSDAFDERYPQSRPSQVEINVLMSKLHRLNRLTVVLFGLLAAAVCVLAVDKGLLDHYHLSRLASARTLAERSHHIDVLVRRRCAKVIPDLLRFYVDHTEEVIRDETKEEYASKLAAFGAESLPYLRQIVDQKPSDGLFRGRLVGLDDGALYLIYFLSVDALVLLTSSEESALSILVGTGLSRDEDESYATYLVTAIQRAAAGDAVVRRRAVSLLEDGIRSDVPSVRWRALWCLRDIGPEAKDAIPALCEALNSSDGLTVLRAVFVLGALEGDAITALPCLEKRLSNPQSRPPVDGAKTVGTDAWTGEDEIQEVLAQVMMEIQGHGRGGR